MKRYITLLWSVIIVVLLTAIANGQTTGDPCFSYTALDQPWRATNATGLWISDSHSIWNGWYRLLYYGMNIRMPESCGSYNSCGSNVALWLNGPHPQISDGIISRQACGNDKYGCCSYSFSIRVKACPGNYYVYEFVKPNICNGAYCADVSFISPVTNSVNENNTEAPVNITSDPCSVYRNLSSNGRKPRPHYYHSGVYDDTLVEWNGWYRLYLQGSSAQIPELHWCSSYMVCGGYAALLLGGPHPLPQDGIVTRDIYGFYPDTSDSKQCTKNSSSNPIQVKACPGNFYVYRLVKPPVSLPMPTYCAVVVNTPSYDPCSSYTSLNQSWRGTNETGGSNEDFISTNWNGWYRLLYNGISVQMPESCISVSRCGTKIPLWLSGSHPQISDGIVTRGICGNNGSDCCYYRSFPIRVKACPGNYYVYEFVMTSFRSSAYCADVKTILPVSNTTATAPSSTQPTTTPIQTISVSSECKGNFTAECAENVFKQIKNSTNPVLPPEIVTIALRQQLQTTDAVKVNNPVSYGNTLLLNSETLVSTLVKPTETTASENISISGLDIQVFAVGPKTSLKEIPPLIVSGAQMDIDLVQISKNNNGSAAVAFMSFTNMGSFLSPNLFSSTNNTEKTMMSSVISATLPKTTNTQLITPVNFTLKHTAELNPKGTLSCVYWKDTEWAVDGCRTIPINDFSTVCSCVHLSTFAVIMETTTPFFIEPPGEKLLEEILNKTFTELPKTVVVNVLNQVMNETMITLATNEDKVNKVEYINNVLMATEKLVSALVTNVETYNITPIILPNLEIQIFTVGPNASLKDILPLNTSTAVLDIDIIEIAKRNNGSAAVAFMSYTNITNMMDPDLFTTDEKTNKTMMSTVVSATLIKITDKKLSKPVNFTFKHTADRIPDSNLTCVYWNNKAWVVDGCNLLQTSGSQTVCSCDHLSTFALIMQTKPPKDSNSTDFQNDDPLDRLNTVLVSVGLVFLSLALLTFVIFRRKLRANNTPRINLCISLLLAHLTFLLTQKFIHYIQPDQMLCAVLAGVLHFLFLSAFVWMLIEAVLLFISVKNLKKIRSKQKEVLDWKWLIVIGYFIPLVVVGVSVGTVPDGYGSKECWLKFDKGFFWSFLGPVCFILASNLILFIIIGVIMTFTLSKRNNPTLQKKATGSDDQLIKSVMFKGLLQFIIIGCFWTFGFFTQISDAVKIIFLIVNSQQGTFIFLIHCVLNYEVRLQYKSFLNRFCFFSKARN